MHLNIFTSFQDNDTSEEDEEDKKEEDKKKSGEDSDDSDESDNPNSRADQKKQYMIFSDDEEDLDNYECGQSSADSVVKDRCVSVTLRVSDNSITSTFDTFYIFIKLKTIPFSMIHSLKGLEIVML